MIWDGYFDIDIETFIEFEKMKIFQIETFDCNS